MENKAIRSENTLPAVKSALVPSRATVPKRELPLYLSVHARLNEKINSQALPKGAVIKERLLASVFGISRGPVRRALKMLEDTLTIKPASGQGFIVGDETAGDILSHQDLHAIFLDRTEPEVSRTPAWESIYDSVRLDVTNCLPFGTYQINEAEACRHFSVGRTALRETLTKLQDHGLLEKSNRSHWIAGPLTARDVHEAFEVRRLLEPEAFVQSATSVPNAKLQAMREKVTTVLANLDETPPEKVEDIENDLHQVLLKNVRNRRLLEAIDRNQLPFIVNRIFRRNFGLKPDVGMLEDHSEILNQLLRSRIDVARTMLEAHLAKAEKNTLAKLRVLSTLPKPATALYLINVH
ncbi:MAG: GntR family transcriptional regulator [Rhizobiaceae bacterium]